MPSLSGAEEAKVRKLLASAKGGDLFCDPEFPATKESLFVEPNTELPNLEWKRPHQIVSKPQVFVDGASRCDVKQGALGDCWFLSAAAAIATRPELIKQVLPEGQVLYGEGYKGLLTFRFWRMGEWLTIIIDDRLPVDDDNDLYYGKCRDPNEFWLPLMEKAFAKFHGNYKSINGGMLAESLTSLTGFITECIFPGLIPEIDSAVKNAVFKFIREELKHDAVITCSRGSVATSGLVPDHAYTVTGARRIKTKEEGVVRLLRVRNPWGVTEWKGAWADGDTRWQKLEASIKGEMEYHPEDDGEFWINMTNFLKQFDGVTVATKLPDQDHKVQYKTLYSMHNAWVKGRTAGGSKEEDITKYATNPQYLLIVKEPDDEDVCQPGEASDDEPICSATKTCNVVIEVIQEHNRKKYENFYPIGFSIYAYKKSKPHKRLTAGDLMEFQQLDGSAEYIPLSSATGRANLEPGSYVIIPSIDMADISRDFLLRVYCRKSITLKELC